MIERAFLTAPRLATLACVTAMIGLPAHAQTPTTSDTRPTAAAPAGTLSLGEIENRLSAQGITIRELEVRDRVVEVEGRDANGKKVEVILDRRSGEILSQKEDR
jgi:hypothetical protein